MLHAFEVLGHIGDRPARRETKSQENGSTLVLQGGKTRKIMACDHREYVNMSVDETKARVLGLPYDEVTGARRVVLNEASGAFRCCPVHDRSLC